MYNSFITNIFIHISIKNSTFSILSLDHLNNYIRKSYLCNKSLMSTISHFSIEAPNALLRSCPIFCTKGNICLIFPVVNVGESFNRRNLHSFPSTKNKCAVKGSTSVLKYNPRSVKCAKSLTSIRRIRSGSLIIKCGE